MLVVLAFFINCWIRCWGDRATRPSGTRRPQFCSVSLIEALGPTGRAAASVAVVALIAIITPWAVRARHGRVESLTAVASNPHPWLFGLWRLLWGAVGLVVSRPALSFDASGLPSKPKSKTVRGTIRRQDRHIRDCAEAVS